MAEATLVRDTYQPFSVQYIKFRHKKKWVENKTRIEKICIRGIFHDTLEFDMCKLDNGIRKKKYRVSLKYFDEYYVVSMGWTKIPRKFSGEEKKWFQEKLKNEKVIPYWDKRCIMLFLSKDTEPTVYVDFFKKLKMISDYRYNLSEGVYEITLI